MVDDWEDQKFKGTIYGSSKPIDKNDKLTIKKRKLYIKFNLCTSNEERKRLIEKEIKLNKRSK